MSADARTLNFRGLLRGLAHRCGLDPDALHVKEAAALAEFLTIGAREAWRGYDWPDTVRTEGRYLRPEFSLAVIYVVEDEVWDPDTGSYYRALQNSFSGQAVTDAAYWEKLSALARVLPWTNEGDNPVAEILGAWDRDPLLDGSVDPDTTSGGHDARPLAYSLTDEGVAFEASAPNTVYVRFRLPPPRFTTEAWSSTAAYEPGDVAFLSPEVYLALEACTGTGQGPASAPERWRAQRVPEVLREAVLMRAKGEWLSGEGEDERALALVGMATDLRDEASETVAKDQRQTRRYGVVTRGNHGRRLFRPRRMGV